MGQAPVGATLQAAARKRSAGVVDTGGRPRRHPQRRIFLAQRLVEPVHDAGPVANTAAAALVAAQVRLGEAPRRPLAQLWIRDSACCGLARFERILSARVIAAGWRLSAVVSFCAVVCVLLCCRAVMTRVSVVRCVVYFVPCVLRVVCVCEFVC